MNKVNNSITLIGNMGKAAELRTLESGKSVCNFSLATSSTYTNKAGEKVTDTQWHDCVAWGKQAETITQYTGQGSKLALSGQLRYDEWQDKEGNNRRTARIHVFEFMFLGSRQERQAPNPGASTPEAPIHDDEPKEPSTVAADDDLPF